MSVTILGQTQIDADTIMVFWESTEAVPVYRIYQDGELVFTGTGVESWRFQVTPGVPLVVEILDQSDGEPSAVHSGHATLNWAAGIAVAYYRVEVYSGAAWVEVERIVDDGAPYFGYQTVLLDDETVYRYRVVPVGVNTLEAVATEFNFLMVRNPDAPDVTIYWDEVGGRVWVDSG